MGQKAKSSTRTNKTNTFRDTDNRMVVTRGEGVGREDKGDTGVTYLVMERGVWSSSTGCLQNATPRSCGTEVP